MALIKPPSPTEFETHMQDIKRTFFDKEDDQEVCHMEMDSYILDVMESLGYKAGVNVFRTTPKWYA